MKGLKAKWNGASQLMRRTIVITVVMAVLAVCCLGKLVYIQLIEARNWPWPPSRAVRSR